MAEQVKAARSKSERKVESPETTETKSAQEKGEELKAAIDDILDDIDEVLNNESVDTVNNFIQKGGE